MARKRQRPPRVYKDKSGRFYILVNRKPKYLKFKTEGVTTQEILNLILKRYLIKRKRKKVNKKLIPYSRAQVTGSALDISKGFKVIPLALKSQIPYEQDINKLNRQIADIDSKIKALPAVPVSALPPAPVSTLPSLPKPVIKPKPKPVMNYNSYFNSQGNYIKNIRTGKNVIKNELLDLLRVKTGDNELKEFKGINKKKAEVILDIIRNEYNNDQQFFEDLQNTNFIISQTAKQIEKKQIKVDDFLRETEEKKREHKLLPPELEEEKSESRSDSEKGLPYVSGQEFGSIELEESSESINESSSQEGDGNKLLGGLTTNQINDLMSKYNKFVGCYPANFMKYIKPNTLGSKFGFIVNTDEDDKPGKHWVACYVDTRDEGEINYYDSFGKEPSKLFMEQIHKLIEKQKLNTYLKMKINKIVDQKANTSNCGQLCCMFLLNRFSGKPFRECTGYDNSKNEEKIIEKFDYI